MEKSFKQLYDSAKKAGSVKDLTPEFHEWKQKGDTLIGVFVSRTPVTSRLGGEPYNQYLFSTDDGMKKFSLGRMTDGEIGAQLVPGQIYCIEYRGKDKISGGRMVNRFSVVEIGASDDVAPVEQTEQTGAGKGKSGKK